MSSSIGVQGIQKLVLLRAQRSFNLGDTISLRINLSNKPHCCSSQWGTSFKEKWIIPHDRTLEL